MITGDEEWLQQRVGWTNGSRVRRLAMLVEYQGTRYSGFQLQARVPTVQGELEEALYRLTGERIRVRGASRTDAGVHARGQVVDFLSCAPLGTETFRRGMNAHLPSDIKVRRSYETRLSFNSRKDASSRLYRYTLVNRDTPSPLLREFAHWVPSPLGVGTMARAASHMVGTHDFGSLAGPLPPGQKSVRHVHRWDVWAEGEMVFMEAEADAFLPHQVRKTASVLLGVGLGRLSEEVLKGILDGVESVPKSCSYLPARGLCLMEVKYMNSIPREGQA